MAAQCVVRAAVVRSRVGYPRVSKSRVRVSASPASRRRVSVAAAFDDTGPGPTHHTPPSIHFLGIGGAGISALAIIALKDGYSVTGSDLRRGEHMDVVESLGAVCFVGHDARNVGGDDVDVGGDNGVDHRDIIKDGKGYTCGERLEETKITKDPTETKRPVPDAVVVSSAVPKDNVELVWARRRGVPIYTRSQWLKRSTAGKSVVAVAGTHGKTSTSAMLATVLLDLGYDVSAVIGGRVRQFPNRANAIGGTDPLFVVEADEYDGAFLGLSPEIALVLNVEFDHPDMFHSLERVVELFKRFVLNVRRAGGVVVANGDDENVVDILQGNNFISFGFGESNDWRATDVTTNQRTGGSDFVITKHNAFVTKVSLKQPGRFAVYNALAAFVAASVAVTRCRESAQTFTNSESVGADSLIMVTRADKSTNSRPQDLYIALTTAIETHTGVERRLQLIGQINDSVFVYDDYAHHPTAVREVLAGVKQRHADAFIVAVFQPHTFRRTSLMSREFTKALASADYSIVTTVFDARPEVDLVTDEFRKEFGEEMICDLTTEHGKKGFFARTHEEATERAVAEVRQTVRCIEASASHKKGNKRQVIVLCLGAGVGFDAAKRVFKALSE